MRLAMVSVFSVQRTRVRRAMARATRLSSMTRTISDERGAPGPVDRRSRWAAAPGRR